MSVPFLGLVANATDFWHSFEQFDELLLLQSGGRVVYNGALGPDSKTLIEYFERNGGKACSPHANPAEVHTFGLQFCSSPDIY